MKEYLDSDRLNYLVWRYLLEGNYRETAAKFQKEWHIHEPHRHFDFAPHIKTHALVHVVSKGLDYLDLERQHIQRMLPADAPPDAKQALQKGIFGPLIHQPARRVEEKEDDGDTPMGGDFETTRKRQAHHNAQVIDAPAKRQRLTNGYETGGADAALMHLDDQPRTHSTSQQPADRDNSSSHGNNHAYPSPQEGEQAPTPPIAHTDGPEQGTQVEKVEELTAETTFLRLKPANGEPQSSASAALSPTAPAATAAPTQQNGTHSENAPILLRCEWSPKDPSILAAAGTDALARVWTLSRATNAPEAGDESSANHVNGANRPSRSLLEAGMPSDATVGQMAWNSKGSAIALAADYDGKACIAVWSADGSLLDKFDVPEPPVIKLRWNPADTALLAVTPEKDGARVTVWQPSTQESLLFSLPGHDLMNWPLDATWTSDQTILLCGGDVMVTLRCTETGLSVENKFETRQDDQFLQVKYDEQSRMAATSSAKGVIDLWDESGRRQTISAHSGAVTALQWQPLPAGARGEETDRERLIASGGDDCAILVWNARKPDQKPKCFMTMDGPIVGLAFTPDGAFIAGAAAGRILIWKVGDHMVPRASWSRTPHPGWLSPKTNSESDEEDEHCLGWDCDGQRLAYGTNSRLAVINFKR